MSAGFVALLREHYSCCGSVSEREGALLAEHFALMVRWNRALNLTRIEAAEEAVVRHYCESLYLADALPHGAFTVADIGSGAGFPGVVVAVRRPDCRMLLVESHQRKAVFLREATRGLPNCQVIAQRAEAGGLCAEWTVSRAVDYRDILGVVPVSVALLLGEEDAARARLETEFEWEPDRRLPWGKRRILVVGQRVVPRGTV